MPQHATVRQRLHTDMIHSRLALRPLHTCKRFCHPVQVDKVLYDSTLDLGAALPSLRNPPCIPLLLHVSADKPFPVTNKAGDLGFSRYGSFISG